MTQPADLIRAAPLGTRMTVRRRIPGGFTDAVGDLVERGPDDCVVETRRGRVRIPLAEVSAAREVPPPPPRRAPRTPPAD